MSYVVIDPVGPYPRHLLGFLGGRLGKAAVAVFTSEARRRLWSDRWSRELGPYVVEALPAVSLRGAAAAARAIVARHGPVEGVVPWDEETVLLGARLSEHLGLDWNTYRVMERCRDKAVMKAWLRRTGTVRINASAVVTDREGALRFLRRVGRWPLVVKPTAGSGSEHVTFPTDEATLLRDCERVRLAGSGRVLLEEYVGGEEMVVNGIVDAHSDLLVTDVWRYDRRTVDGVPNLYWLTHRVPTHDPVFGRVGAYAAAVVEALGLRRAPIHMEVKVDDRGPCLIEVGARFAGGNLPWLASRLHGRSLFELAACQYLSEAPLRADDLDLPRYDRIDARVVHGVQTHELPRIRAVHGVEVVEALPSFEAFGLLRHVGQVAPVTRDYDTAAWELSLVHERQEQVDADAEVARRVLRYE